jgi:xanthine dehydrogenase small subunit
VPPPVSGARMVTYKVSKRREMDISAVACGLYLETDDAGVVTVARFAFGGMAATPARAKAAEAAVVGQAWTAGIAEEAALALSIDFKPLSDHRGSAWYRSTVAANCLRGFFIETEHERVPRLSDRPSGTLLTPGEAPLEQVRA